MGLAATALGVEVETRKIASQHTSRASALLRGSMPVYDLLNKVSLVLCCLIEADAIVTKPLSAHMPSDKSPVSF